MHLRLVLLQKFKFFKQESGIREENPQMKITLIPL